MTTGHGASSRMRTRRISPAAKPWLAAICVASAIGFSSTPVLAAGTGSSGITKPAVTAVNNGGLVALGDSVTFGYNLNPANLTPSAQAYPELVGAADKLPVTNLGIPSWTSADLLSVMTAPNFDRAIQNAKVVSIDIGNNDLVHLASSLGLLKQGEANPTAPITITSSEQAQFAATIQQMAENLGAIVTAVKAQTNAPVVVYNLYNPFPVGSGLNAAAKQFVPAANQAIAAVAAKLNVPVLDAYSAFDGKQTQLVRAGDIHPTAAGQQVLAGLLESELQKLSLPKGASAGANDAVTTSLATHPVDPAGSTWAANLGQGSVTLTAPAGAIPFNDNVAVTSVNTPVVQNLAPANDTIVAEFGVDFASGDTPTKAVTVKYVNANIPADAQLEEVVGNKLVPMPGAIIGQGQVSTAVIGDGDFVVVAPKSSSPSQPPTVPGATSPETGFPWLTDAIAGVLLVLFGAFVLVKSRRRNDK